MTLCPKTPTTNGPRKRKPAQIPDRGQYGHASHRSEVEEVGLSHKGPRERTAHTDETGTGRAESEKMSDAKTQSWPSDKVQRRLRFDEALIEMVRAERVFLASR